MPPPESSDFRLQPFQDHARTPESPRILEEGQDATYPAAPEEEGVAEGGGQLDLRSGSPASFGRRCQFILDGLQWSTHC